MDIVFRNGDILRNRGWSTTYWKRFGANDWRYFNRLVDKPLEQTRTDKDIRFYLSEKHWNWIYQPFNLPIRQISKEWIDASI